MAETRRLLQWGLLLVLLAMAVIGATTYALYRTALQDVRHDLRDLASSQAALIGAVARFDRKHSPGFPSSATELASGGKAATLSQLRDAFLSHPGLGHGGELVLGSGREDIVIFLRQRGEPGHTRRVPRDSSLAEPMRRALAGDSGTIIAQDYAGDRVLAAFQPLPELGWGLVAKRDLAAIRAPYVRAALATGGLGIGLVLITGFLFTRVSDPLIKRLRRSEARYAQLLDAANEAILVVDASNQVVFANPMVEKVYGVDPRDAVGKPIQELLPSTMGDTIREKLQERSAGQSSRYQLDYPHPTAGDRILQVAASPLYSPDGAYEGSLSLATDITDEYRAQEHLDQERQLLRTVLDALPVAVWILDREGRFLLHNPFAETVWARRDWERPQAGPSFPEFQAWDAESGDPLPPDAWVAATTLREGRAASDQVVEIQADDGTRRFLRNASIPLWDAGGELDKVVVVTEDITEERRYQDQLRRERALLQQVLDTLPIGVWVVDANGQFILHNPTGEQIWQGAHYQGGQDAYAEYKGWWSETGAEIAPEEWAVARAVNRGETSLDEVIDIQCFDGSIKTILNASVPMFADDGSIRGAIIVNEDITERRAMERMLQRNEQLLELVLNNLPVGVAVTDEHGNFILTNEADTAIWEGSRLGRPAGDGDIRGYREGQTAPIDNGDWPIQRALKGLAPILEDTLEVVLPGGKAKSLAVSAAPILGHDNSLWGAAEIIHDVTQRRHAEAERRKLADALRHTADAVFLMDAEGRIEYVNPAFERITGYRLEECRGKRPEEFLDAGRQPPEYYDQVWHTIRHGHVFRDVVLNRSRDGQLFNWEKTLSPLLDSDGHVVSVIGTATDITAQREIQDQLYQATRYDPLTQLPNRALLLERLDGALARTEWSERTVALALLDLDNFTMVNDSLGHQVGDEVLCEVGRRLSEAVREGDVVARTGDDGFAVLLDGIAQDSDLPPVLQHLREALQPPFEVDGHTLHLDAQFGVSLAPADATDAQSLFRNADTALAQARRSTASGTQFYAAEMASRANRQLAIENGLRQSLEDDAFALHFQPQVELASGRLRGFEALLRWEHPELGPISPAEFIPVAEQAGLIIPIGDWVLDRALRHLAEWRQDGLDPGYLSVNLSPLQLQEPELVGKVAQALASTGQAGERLELEVTETTLMSQLGTGADRLRSLAELGVRLAVDDFGTGYSSLAYLSRLPLDTLKIDRSFMADIGQEGGKPSIILAVLSLAHSLGLEVVAEGVETAAQLDFLRRHGSDVVQGFYLGRPTPADEIPALLARESWL